jgi:hypothetical protein
VLSRVAGEVVLGTLAHNSLSGGLMDSDMDDARKTPEGVPEPSQELLEVLRIFEQIALAVGAYDVIYRGTVRIEFVRHGGKVKRRSIRKIEKPFEILCDSVVAFQTSYRAVCNLAAVEGIPLSSVRDLSEVFEHFTREYADYLAAESDDAVWEAAHVRAMRKYEQSEGVP